jgi:hypothetical protein
MNVTEHQLFEVSERSIFIDFSPSFISNAFLNLFSNVLSPVQALWQACWPSAELKSLQLVCACYDLDNDWRRKHERRDTSSHEDHVTCHHAKRRHH